eukprot:403372067
MEKFVYSSFQNNNTTVKNKQTPIATSIQQLTNKIVYQSDTKLKSIPSKNQLNTNAQNNLKQTEQQFSQNQQLPQEKVIKENQVEDSDQTELADSFSDNIQEILPQKDRIVNNRQNANQEVIQFKRHTLDQQKFPPSNNTQQLNMIQNVNSQQYQSSNQILNQSKSHTTLLQPQTSTNFNFQQQQQQLNQNQQNFYPSFLQYKIGGKWWSIIIKLSLKSKELGETVDHTGGSCLIDTLQRDIKEYFQLECDRALDSIKDSYRKLTEDSVSELSRIKNPPQILQDIAIKFLQMLKPEIIIYNPSRVKLPNNQGNTTQLYNWIHFQEFCRNYSNFKEQMYNFIPEDISEDTLSTIMPIVKQQQTLNQKMQKLTSKQGPKFILDFICASTEYKLKKDIFNQASDVTLVAHQNKIEGLMNEKEALVKGINNLKETIENMAKYLQEINKDSGSKEKVRELSREAIRKFQLTDHYEVLIDSTLDKNQPKTILKYKREGKRSFNNEMQHQNLQYNQESQQSIYLHNMKDSFQSLGVVGPLGLSMTMGGTFNNQLLGGVGGTQNQNIYQSYNQQQQQRFPSLGNEREVLSNYSQNQQQQSNQKYNLQQQQQQYLGEIGGTYDINPMQTSLSPQSLFNDRGNLIPNLSLNLGNQQPIKNNRNNPQYSSTAKILKKQKLTEVCRQKAVQFQWIPKKNESKVLVKQVVSSMSAGAITTTMQGSLQTQTRSLHLQTGALREWNQSQQSQSQVQNLVQRDILTQNLRIDAKQSIPFKSAHKPNPSDSANKGQRQIQQDIKPQPITNLSQHLLQRSKLQTPDITKSTFITQNSNGNQKQQQSYFQKIFDFNESTALRHKKSSVQINTNCPPPQYSLIPMRKDTNMLNQDLNHPEMYHSQDRIQQNYNTASFVNSNKNQQQQSFVKNFNSGSAQKPTPQNSNQNLEPVLRLRSPQNQILEQQQTSQKPRDLSSEINQNKIHYVQQPKSKVQSFNKQNNLRPLPANRNINRGPQGAIIEQSEDEIFNGEMMQSRDIDEMHNANTDERSVSAFEMITSCKTRFKKFFCYY